MGGAGRSSACVFRLGGNSTRRRDPGVEGPGRPRTPEGGWGAVSPVGDGPPIDGWPGLPSNLGAPVAPGAVPSPLEPRCSPTLGGEGSSPHGVQKGQLPWVSSPPAGRVRASMCALNRNTGWLGYLRTPTMIPRKEAWGGGGGCRWRGSGVSLCGVIHVSLVQGSVPRRQA